VSFREVIQTFRRRWVVLAVGAVLTAIAGWFAIHPAPSYRAVAVLSLQAPRNENTPNQFNDGRPSIALTGALIVARLESRSGRAQLRRDGVRAKYDLAPRNSGTTATPAYLIASVEITLTTGDPAAATRWIGTIINRFGSELDSVQAGLQVPDTQRITVGVLAPPSVVPMYVVKSRALLGVALFGGIGSVLATLRLDRYLAFERYAARRRPHGADTTDRLGRRTTAE
jgi:hypothetical protein